MLSNLCCCVLLCFPQLSQESIKSAHRRLVVAHILPATLGEPTTSLGAADASIPGSPPRGSLAHSAQQQLSPERYSLEATLDPEDEKEKEVRALLAENRGNFSKIFEVYTRRSKQMTIDAWLAFCTDFDLTNALSKTVLSTVFRGAALSLPSGGGAESSNGYSHVMSTSMMERSQGAEFLSMRQFLQALRKISCLVRSSISPLRVENFASLHCLHDQLYFVVHRPHSTVLGDHAIGRSRSRLLRAHHRRSPQASTAA